MIITSLLAAFLFVILSMSGFGFVLAVDSPNNNSIKWIAPFALAPVVGISLFSLVGTYLILANHPAEQWYYIVASLILIASFSLILIQRNKFRTLIDNINVSELKTFALGLLITFTILFLPMIFGGVNFFILRGNAGDQFNYLNMANFLLYEPYQTKALSTHTLANIMPSYAFIPALLKGRWTTSLLLGWLSRLVNQSTYHFIYSFALIFYMSLYCVVFGICRYLHIKPVHALLVGVATCVGLWGQFVLDINAISELNGIPMLLGIACALLYTSTECYSLRNILIMALLTTCLVLLYTEMTPTLMLGLGLFYIFNAVAKSKYIKPLGFYFFVGGVSAILLLPPMTNYLFDFLLAQIFHAASSAQTPEWWFDFFGWLYNWHFVAFWGLCFTAVTATKTFTAFLVSLLKMFSYALAALLTLTFFYGISLIVSRKLKALPESILIVIAFAIAGLIQFSILYFHHEWWSAAKGLSFVYPFYFLVVCTVGLSTIYKMPVKIKKFASYTILLWLAIQALLGIERIIPAIYHQKIVMYPAYGGRPYPAYRNYDFNFSEINAYLQQHKIQRIAFDVRDPWVGYYLSIAFGRETQVMSLQGIQLDKILMQQLTPVPKYMLVDKKDSQFFTINAIAQNKSFKLIATPEFVEQAIQEHQWATIFNVKMHPLAWWKDNEIILSNSANELTVYSESNKTGHFSGIYSCTGCTADKAVKLVITKDNMANSTQNLSLKNGVIDFKTTLQKGVNDISLSITQDSHKPSKSLIIKNMTLH